MRRGAFTLVELVVVVLILGILAVIAAPIVISNSAEATDNGLRQTLSVVRGAIEMYRAENMGAFPGASDGNEATFKSDLAPYLRGPFPAGPTGPAEGDDRIRMKSDGVPLDGHGDPNRAWKYDYTTGEFIFNYGKPTASDSSVNYDEL